MLYPKIHSVFKRYTKEDRGYIPLGCKVGDLIWSKFAKEEFAVLADLEWVWKEKLDGMNIGIEIRKTGVRVHGKTEKAELPAELDNWLSNYIKDNIDRIFEVFDIMNKPDDFMVHLFGEGVGEKIQKGGGKYGKQHFKLFDICIRGIWLTPHSVEEIAHSLGLDYAPVRFSGSIWSALEYIETKPESSFGNFIMEGIVGTPNLMFRDRRGERIITKIKVKDLVKE